MSGKFDAILVIAFGGPEKAEDIRPFLANVTRGRPIPEERIEEVAHHYEIIGGKSPLNELTFRQARGLESALKGRGSALPVYVGMRNWHPLLSEAVKEMSKANVRRAIGVIMAAHESEASWQRYQQNVSDAIADTNTHLSIKYTPPLFDHPLFVESVADRIEECLIQISHADRKDAILVFTAHSIPTPMANESPYVEQFTKSSRLVAERLGHENWTLAYQSRSGRPTDPWLEPDVCDVIRDLSAKGAKYVVVAPIGFVCDHVEVLYDLDIKAAGVAKEVGIKFLRAKTVNDDPKFIAALADVVEKHIHQPRTGTNLHE